ncbi:rod shape-determining protein MreD [Streptococcus pneumoniae]
MKLLKYVCKPLLMLFICMLVDTHLSNLLQSILPMTIYPVAHLLLIFLLFLSINLPDAVTIGLLLVIGILYDAYYFHLIGIVALILPSMGIFVNHFGVILMRNRWTRLLSVLILIVFFDSFLFAMASLLGISMAVFSHFVVYMLAPTLVLNVVLVLLLQPVMEKIYL